MPATTTTTLTGAGTGRTVGDRYLGWLGWILLGYALMSRGFAYWGVPPLFVGEMTLLFGTLAMLKSRSLPTVMQYLPAQLLVGLMVWGAVCTFPYVSTYGFESFRDAALWAYGLFGFITAAVLIERPERLKEVLIRYRKFVVVFLLLIWAFYLAYKTNKPALPELPWANAMIFEAKGGDILVHLTGVTAFLLIGMIRSRPWMLLMLALNLALIVVSNRGGMLAFGTAMFAILVLKPPHVRLARFGYGISVVLILLALVNPSVKIHGNRAISVEQIWLNIKSIVSTEKGPAGASSLEGTETWRLDWWTKILHYTFGGEYFWTGKGYGVNLADADGFQVYGDHSLRSPHNGHLTFLARSGVPGFLLWIGAQLSWLWLVLSGMRRSRQRRDYAWTGIFLFFLAYWLACLVNASFDVYLEGPMGAVWFWTIFGGGLAAVHIYRTRPEVAWT